MITESGRTGCKSIQTQPKYKAHDGDRQQRRREERQVAVHGAVEHPLGDAHAQVGHALLEPLRRVAGQRLGYRLSLLQPGLLVL